MTDHTLDAVMDRISDAYHASKMTPGSQSPMHSALSALLPGDRLPGGNVVVPIEPAKAMLRAGWKARFGTFVSIWRAMIEASHDK